MNMIYRVVWNSSTNSWVVASEMAKGKKKTSSRSSIAGALSLVALGATGIANAGALDGGQIINSSNQLAIGQGSVASSSLDYRASIAVGHFAKAMADGSIAMGDSSYVVQGNTPGSHDISQPGGIAIGMSSWGNGLGVVALGYNSSADGNYAATVGYGSSATAQGATALGHAASAPIAGAVALGENSMANRGAGAGGSTLAAASVGNGPYSTRQIISVARGTQDTDAVNLSQLKGAVQIFGSGAAVDASGNVTKPSYVINGTPYNDVGSALNALSGVTNVDALKWNNSLTAYDAAHNASPTSKITHVAAGTVGTGSTDAVNGSQLYGTAQSVADSLGGGSLVDGNGKITKPVYSVQGQPATGVDGAIAALDKSITSGTIDAVKYDDSNHTLVTFHKGGAATKLSNVANGTGSADAVNVSQLQGVTNAIGGGAAIDPTTGAILNPNIKVGDTTYTNVAAAIEAAGKVGGDALNWNANTSTYDASHGTSTTNRITHVAAGTVGTGSTDVVNGSQLYGTAQSVATVIGGGSGVDANGAITKPTITVGTTPYNDVTSAIQAASTRIDAIDALKWNDANKAYDASHGTSATNRITNVAAGSVATGSTDVVNGDQLNTVAVAIANITGGTAGLVQQKSADANIQVAGSSAGTAVDFNGTAGNRRLINVASGTGATDAANVGQLNGVANAIGGGATVNSDGTIKGPSISVGSATYHDTTSAIQATAQVLQNSGLLKVNGGLLQAAPGLLGAGAVVGSGYLNLTDSTSGTSYSMIRASYDTSTVVPATSTLGKYSQIWGLTSQGVGQHALSIGDQSNASGDNSAAVGANTIALANGTALGNSATTQAANGTALGQGATAANAGDVALGAGSTTGAAAPTKSVTLGGATYSFAGNNPGSVVSVGSAGNERQITNVAAGRLSATSTDAVNGSQLDATNQAVQKAFDSIAGINPAGAGAVTYDDPSSKTLVTFNKGGAATTLSNVADGKEANDAVNLGQLQAAQTRYYSANDNGSQDGNYDNDGASGKYATAVGVAANASANNAAAVGYKSNATVDGGVALGSQSLANTAAGAAGYDPATGKASTTSNATWASTAGAVSVGAPAAGGVPAVTRQITNVAAGSQDTDAVNVAQLKNVASAAGAGWDVTDGVNTAHIGGNGVLTFKGDSNVSVNQSGTDNAGEIDVALAKNLSVDSITAGSTVLNANGLTITGGPSMTVNGIDAGSKAVTNVADGVNPADAVNKGQLDDSISQFSELADKIKYIKFGATAALDAAASGNNSLAIGGAAQAGQNGSVAIGGNTSAGGVNSVAVGYGSVATDTNEFSVGGGKIQRRITNVADGVLDSDVATVGQMNTAIDNALNPPKKTMLMSSSSTLMSSGSMLGAAATSSVTPDKLVFAGPNGDTLTASDAKGNKAFAGGLDAHANADNAVAIGQQVNVLGVGGLVVGVASGTNAVGGVVIGGGSTSLGGSDNSVVIGNSSSIAADQPNSVAIGYYNKLGGTNTVGIGDHIVANGDNNIILGSTSSDDNRENVVSVGSTGKVAGSGKNVTRQIINVAAGTQSTDVVNVSQLQGVVTALGGGAAINATTGAVTGPTYSVANGSYTDVGKALTALDNQSKTGNPLGVAYDDNTFAKVTLKNQANGGTTIAGVKAAAARDEAVNLGQLEDAGVFDPTGNSLVMSYDDASKTTATLNKGGHAVKVTNVDAATGRTDAVNLGQLQDAGVFDPTGNSLVMSYDDATKTTATLNKGGQAVKVTNVAAATGRTDAVNLGQLEDAGLFDGNGNSLAVSYDDSSKAQVSFNKGGAATVLNNIAAGAVTGTSNQAVNGSQLYSTAQSMATALGGGSTINPATGAISTPSYKVGGQTVTGVGGAIAALDNQSKTGSALGVAYDDGSFGKVTLKGQGNGGTTIAGVKAGVQDDEAVNVKQLKDAGIIDPSGNTNTAVTYDHNADGSTNNNSITLNGGDAGTVIHNIADGTAATDAVNKGQLDAAVTDAIAQGGNNAMFAADGNRQTEQASATGTHATAMGANASATADNSVALGAGSVADRANSVSVGSAGNERQITNVAAGTSDTDAVNVAQMKQAATSATSSANQYTDTQISGIQNQMSGMQSQLNDQFNKVDKRIASGNAMSAAMMTMGASMSSFTNSDNRFGAGTGYANGRSALSVGYQRALGSKANMTIGASTSGHDSSIGVGFGVGL